MLALGGLGFLLACVFGTFVAEGGSIGAVLEALPFEFVTIGGAAVATFVIANSMHAIRHTLGGFRKVLRGAIFAKSDYVDLLSLLFYFVRLANTKGTMALETHIERPEESSAFRKFPKILANRHATGMICDYLRMVGMNADDPHQIEDVMARELRKTLQEELHSAHALQVVADALPAFGIVAAVLGVIKTMAHIAEPPMVLGRMIGEALTGTFLGVLLAYGVAAPFSARLKA
ncbi:MAG TPA: motility-associated protein, partial [Acetobacteraceae bacterium]|nr:motility-associated protein [Acetobacteraceae bacterium]